MSIVSIRGIIGEQVPQRKANLNWLNEIVEPEDNPAADILPYFCPALIDCDSNRGS